MTIEQAMELIHGVEWRGSRPGLARVRELLHRLGDPQDGLQFVHIAGTNGKGSTAANSASGTGTPLTCMRSAKRSRYGDVNSPVV